MQTLKINGIEARRFETEGKDGLERRTFVGTVLQGTKEVVWINAWAPTAHYDRYKSELLHFSESVVGLQEAQSETSLQPADVPRRKSDSPTPRDASEVPAARSSAALAPKSDPVDQRTPDIADRLRKLNELHKEGLIDEQDYEAKKAEILKTL